MTDDPLKLLDRVDPVDRERLRAMPTPEDELRAILVSSPTEARGTQRRRELVLRAVPVAAGIALAVVAVTALLPGGGDDGGGIGNGAAPDAARALESAAATAAAEVVPADAGKYEYSRVQRVDLATVGDPPPYSYYLPETVESWIAPDGSGRVRETEEPPEWPGPRDKQRWSENPFGFGKHERTTDRRYGPGELSGRPYEAELPPVRELPTDPDELARVFEAERNESSSSVPLNAKMFEYGTSVLLQPGTSAEVRSATYEVLAGIEGVELREEARDPLGRRGVEVSIVTGYAGGDERYALIYDERTAYPLAYEERLLKPASFVDSLVIGYAVLEESGRVGSVEDRP